MTKRRNDNGSPRVGASAGHGVWSVPLTLYDWARIEPPPMIQTEISVAKYGTSQKGGISTFRMRLPKGRFPPN